jgi:hypothetical protein
MVFVRAEEGPPNYGSKSYTVQYFDEKGNMIYTQRGFAVRRGAIGKAAGMAIFPTETMGRGALVDL